MGTKNSKAAGDGLETDVDKENDDLLEAVESLPKVETLKSVKKPKGPKGRKPPSRTFLQTIVSYFQVKPETSNKKKDVEIMKKEPEVVLDLNVVEKAAVLENVTKGRPAPPGNRRRPARVRNTKPRETEDNKPAEVVEADVSENTKKEKETKVFLKPPNRSESKWKAIGILTVPADDIKTPKDITENNGDILTEQNNNLEAKIEEDVPESLPSEALSQAPGKPPRPSLEKSEKKRSTNDFVQKEEKETIPSIEKRTSKEIKPKPILPKSDKPKPKALTEKGEDVEEEIETPNKNDFMRDLNKKLQIQPPSLLIKNESSKDEFHENLETCSIEVEKNNTEISIKVTTTEIEDQVHLSSDKENINETSSDSGKQTKKDKIKKKGIFHKIKKMNLEATKKFNRSFSKSFERKSADSDICPIPQPLDENQPIIIKSEDETLKVDESRTVSPQSNPLYTENTDGEIKEEIVEIEPPNPKMYMKHVMKPNMLEELNIKLNKTKLSPEVQSPEQNFVSEKSQKPKPLLPHSPKPIKQEENILAHPAPHSPVVLKPFKRVAKEKRATSKTFSSENLNKFDEGKCDAENSSPLSNVNNYNRSKTVNEEELLFKNREEIMIEKKLSLPNNVHKRSAHSIALDDAFNILDFELNFGEKPLENVQEEEDTVQIKTSEEKVPRGIRKKSCQSVALDNAFNILDFELEPLATVVDEETETEVEEVEEAPMLRNGTVDLSSRDKSAQSIELESCLSILGGELDNVETIEELHKIAVNEEVVPNIEEQIHNNPTIEGENESKVKHEFSPEMTNSELRSSIGDTKDEKRKSQQKEQLGLSFDLGCEPSVDESKTDYL